MGDLRRAVITFAVPALLAASGASPAVARQPAPYGGLQPGVRYLAAESDVQRVEFFVVGELNGGGARLALSVDVQCEEEFGPLVGSNFLTGTVDADGRINAEGRASSEEEEDIFTGGPVEVSGQLGPDGAVTGTVDVELKVDLEDGDSCEAPDQPWRSAPVADPGVARILGTVPAKRSIVEAGAGLAATEDALYVLTQKGERTRLHRLDPTTGGVEWSVKVAGADILAEVVAGAGVVWVANVAGDDGPVVAGFDPDDGDRVGEAPGTAIAFGPDEVGWTVEEGGDRLRRVEGRPPEVTDTFEMPGELKSTVAAGADGVCVLYLDADESQAIALIDPETGDVGARVADELFNSALLVTEGSVWVTGLGGTQRLDSATLQTLGVDEEATAQRQVVAPPGVWLVDAGLIQVLDGKFPAAFSVPLLFGSIAAAGDSVWLLEDSLGLLHLRAG